jgi:acetyl esterase
LLSEKDLKGLPPTTIITVQIDPLRSEGKAYADLLQQAGIVVRYKIMKVLPMSFSAWRQS